MPIRLSHINACSAVIGTILGRLKGCGLAGRYVSLRTAVRFQKCAVSGYSSLFLVCGLKCEPLAIRFQSPCLSVPPSFPT